MTFEASEGEELREAVGDGSSFADHLPAAVVTASSAAHLVTIGWTGAESSGAACRQGGITAMVDADRRALRKCPAQHSSESTDHRRSAHSRLWSARFRSRRSS